MSDLKEKFERLGLSQYLGAFIAEGFDTWDIVVDIAESDLTSLKVKLGHRRKLQRAIAEWRGQTIETPLPISRRRTSLDESYRSDESGTESKVSVPRDAPAIAAPVTTKRKYRRHPKTDENAPERPPSAYVIFSNQVRETLKGQELSFADIAKIVGERWQVLSPESREACDKQAATAKERYYQELAEYKKTPQYAQYQAYLADFKAKHSNTAGREEGKRSRLETEASVSTQSSGSGLDKTGRSMSRQIDGVLPPGTTRVPLSAENLEASARTPSYVTSAATSPHAMAFSGMESPHAQDRFMGASASPPSAMAFRDGPLSASPHSHNLRERRSDYGSRPASLVSHVTGSPSTYIPPPIDPPFDIGGNRPPVPELLRADSSNPSVPSLVRTETTTSSHSGASRPGSVFGAPPTLPPLSSLDAPKPHRVLPQPIPMAGVTPSPLDNPISGPPTKVLPPPPTGTEGRSGLSALLIASELVRGNNTKKPPDERPP